MPITFEVAENICDELITDEEWLWQMLLNLLTNACKYTAKGSIKVKISLELHKAVVQMLQVEVIDTGEQISC